MALDVLLQFDTCTEYRWRQVDYGGGQGVMRPDFSPFWLGLERSRCAKRRQIALKTKSEKYARKPRGSTLHCNRGRLRTLLPRYHTAKTRCGYRPINFAVM